MRGVLVLVVTLLFAGCDLQGEKQRRAMENNLKQIDLAIKNYEESYRKLDDPNRSGGLEENDPSASPK